MQKNLCTLLNVAKDDSSKMLQAINLFSPLIQKYSKKLMLRQIIFLLLHQLFTIAFLIAVQQKRFFMKAFRRSYDSVSRHYKFPELKNTEDIGNKTIGFQKTVNSFCKNIIFSFNARIA